jgi:hypothetical protein
VTAGWWPSRYGAQDQAGALNEITPANVLEAVRLVRRGRVYDLAHKEDLPKTPANWGGRFAMTYGHAERNLAFHPPTRS